MDLTLSEALEQGIAAHRQGKLGDAERLYRAILQAQPMHPDANHNLGVLAVAVGKPLEAVPLFKLALEANPQIEQFWLSYIDVLVSLERFDDARRVLVDVDESVVSRKKLEFLRQQVGIGSPGDKKNTRQGLTLSEKRKRLAEKKKKQRERGDTSEAVPSQEQINRLIDYYQAERLAEAETLAVSLTRQFPNHPFGWKVLGAHLKQVGRLNDSLTPMRRSVELSPNDAEAHNNLGVTLQEIGRLDEAEACLKHAIALKADYADAQNNLGVTLHELREFDGAEARYRKAIELEPRFVEAHNNLGVTLRKLGKFDEAEISYRQAIALAPDFIKAHCNLGVTLQESGRLEEAEARLRYAITLCPTFAEAHSNLAAILQELGAMEEARASLEKAISVKPEFAEAHRFLALAKNFVLPDEQFSQMQVLYRDPELSEHDRCHICFALAKASEDVEDIASAYQLYAEGNALRRKQIGYDTTKDKRLFESLKTNYPLLKAHSRQPCTVAPEPAPIFLVGMPRSGTTLVEQIISAHPLVTGAGELSFAAQSGIALATGHAQVNAEALMTFREAYLNALKKRSEGLAIVTDKMPQNFRLLGLINAALPEAKIIHVKRDSAAVCWANYTQYFVNDSLNYCYSLDDILHYYELYQDLMKYWHQALPNRIYDLDYEALTENQEEETRNLIGHLELEWDDACLSPQDNTRAVATASNAQVRQKVYKGSSEKWKRYLPFLNGSLDHLSIGKSRQ